MNKSKKFILNKNDLEKFKNEITTILSDDSMSNIKGGDYLEYIPDPYENYAESSYGDTGVYLDSPL